jgi:TM2 domain-containing membrane protein YozV
MNCAQHTDTAAVAYCRTCGKALCEICKRDVQGTIFCESCLAARIHPGGSGNFGSAPGNYGAGESYPPPNSPRGPEDASPGLALFLGFIPGVGAFYNGQFLKGFVHVIVMSTLIWMSDHGMGGFAGLLIAAWVFYMVFDAWTTAKARRYGLPIPDPLGLNAILEGREGTFRQRVEQAGERMGSHMEYAAHNIGQHWHQAGGATPGGTTSNAAPGNVAPGANPGAPPPPPGAEPFGTAYNAASSGVPPQGTYYSGPEGTYYAAPANSEPRDRERSPVGAIVLIGLGVLFLLANLGWFSFYWISHFWPVILIMVGLWLFIKRQRDGR